MSIREFNREYSMMGVKNHNMSAEEAMQLHCLMVVSSAFIHFPYLFRLFVFWGYARKFISLKSISIAYH